MGSGISTRRRIAKEKLEDVVAANINTEEKVNHPLTISTDFILYFS
jgi:hypothetical protein